MKPLGTGLLLVGLILTSACTTDDPPTSIGNPNVETAPTDCSAAQYDISREPDYPVDYIHRWTTEEGCEVRLDVLMTRQGEEACGGSQVADILMGTPLGRPPNASAARIYIKDPTNVFGDDETSDAYEADAELPDDAGDSGYRQDGTELWITPDDDRFIYLVAEGSVERWPQDESPPGCG